MKHTKVKTPKSRVFQPPSGGCVLKQAVKVERAVQAVQPPSGGCVLKLVEEQFGRSDRASRLRAAVC